MAQKILDIETKDVDNAVTLWRAGQLVAIPTETVYGLAADATNGEAVARIYSTKLRPSFNPLIVHIAELSLAQEYAVWNDQAEALARQWWPGPLTLVLPRRAGCALSELALAGGDTVALRMPAHPVALRLLRAFGRGIAAPSANRSGRISPTTAQHVRDELGDAVPLIIDGGPCTVGVESTVLDLSGETPVMLRPGAITRDMLEGVIGDQWPRAGDTRTAVLKSPGMLASHYAPSITVRLDASNVAADEALLAFGPTPLTGAASTLNLSPRGDLLEAAANLFAHLRALDVPAHRAIAVMPIPAHGIGEAIRDRLMRAATR